MSRVYLSPTNLASTTSKSTPRLPAIQNPEINPALLIAMWERKKNAREKKSEFYEARRPFASFSCRLGKTKSGISREVPSIFSRERARTCRMWRRNPLGGTKKFSDPSRELRWMLELALFLIVRSLRKSRVFVLACICKRGCDGFLWREKYIE